MVKWGNTSDLGSDAARFVGSSPIRRTICPNCDSQLDTYKSKNKNGARTHRKYYLEECQSGNGPDLKSETP